jgi:hypothetical protein
MRDSNPRSSVLMAGESDDFRSFCASLFLRPGWSAYGAVVFFGQYFVNYRSSTIFGPLLSIGEVSYVEVSTKKRAWLHFGRFFRKPIWSPWLRLCKLDVIALSSRVARWHIFKPKIPIWVNFGGSSNGRGWYILWPYFRPFGLFCGHLVHFMVIWYIFLFWYVVLRKIWHPCCQAGAWPCRACLGEYFWHIL